MRVLTPARRKARILALTGVVLGFGSTSYAVVFGSFWPFQLLTVAVFGLACAIGGITWWTTRLRELLAVPVRGGTRALRSFFKYFSRGGSRGGQRMVKSEANGGRIVVIGFTREEAERR